MQLEFTQAMTDFKTMFPDMDDDVIEAVLRANQGAVDATIDQLLTMSTDNQNERLRQEIEQDENGQPIVRRTVPLIPVPVSSPKITANDVAKTPRYSKINILESMTYYSFNIHRLGEIVDKTIQQIKKDMLV